MTDKTWNCISCGALNSGLRTNCGNCNKKRNEKKNNKERKRI